MESDVIVKMEGRRESKKEEEEGSIAVKDGVVGENCCVFVNDNFR